MAEIWKDIEGFEGRYQISTAGRVRSLKIWDVNKKMFIGRKEPVILKPNNNGNGYYQISMSRNGKRRQYYIHRLVADAFLQKESGKDYINHKDYNRKNNSVENLEWCTQKENVNYSAKKMRKRKTVPRGIVKEQYISFRKSNNTFRVIIDRKEYGCFKNVKDAIIKRDQVLFEKGVV